MRTEEISAIPQQHSRQAQFVALPVGDGTTRLKEVAELLVELSVEVVAFERFVSESGT